MDKLLDTYLSYAKSKAVQQTAEVEVERPVAGSISITDQEGMLSFINSLEQEDGNQEFWSGPQIRAYRDTLIGYLAQYDGTQQELIYLTIQIQQRCDQLIDQSRQYDLPTQLIDVLNDGICVLDQRLTILYCNETLAKKTRIPVSYSLGRSTLDFFPEKDNQEAYNAIKAAFQNQVTGREYLTSPADGQIFNLEVIPLETHQGKVNNVLVVFKNTANDKAYRDQLKDKLLDYASMVEGFPAMIWRVDAEKRGIYFNEHWLNDAGLTQRQARQENWIDRVHTFDQEMTQDKFLWSFENRIEFIHEFRRRKKDGNYGWVAAFGAPLYDHHGHFMGFLFTSFDIQNRKAMESALDKTNQELISTLHKLKSAEQNLLLANNELERKVRSRTRALAEQEKQLRSNLNQTIQLNHTLKNNEKFLSRIIEQTPSPTLITDSKGQFVKCNPSYLDLFQLENFNTDYILFEDQRIFDLPFYHLIQKAFQSGEVVKFVSKYDLKEKTFQEQDKSGLLYLNTTIFPVKNVHHQIQHVVFQFENMTEKILSEKAIKASEAQLSTITNALPVLISYVDIEERYQFVNQPYTDWFDLQLDDIIGKKVIEVLGETAYYEIKPMMDKAFAGNNVSYERLMPYRFGSKRYVITNIIPHIQDQKTVGCFAMVTDITSQKKVQKNLLATNKKLVSINNEMDDFIYTASHDLKSPIVNMEGLLLAINRTMKAKTTSREAELFLMMEDSIHKLKATIKHLSNAARIGKENSTSTENIDIQNLVSEVKSEIQHLAVDTNPTFHEHYHENTFCFVRENLKSILHNLLTNAIKYRSFSRPLEINIQTRQENSYFVLSIEDNGLGMQLHQQEKLFTLFKRLHTHVEGTGIGLYIIKRIVDNAGGKIKVNSEPDKGSNFQVYLPINIL